MTIQEVAEAYAAAWCSGDPVAVASFYAEDGKIIINRGDPHEGRAAVLEMVTGFYSEFPGLIVRLEHLRIAGNHVMFGWVLEGTHSQTGKTVSVPGWEEWDLDENLKVKSSLGWFDAAEYDRQVREGL